MSFTPRLHDWSPPSEGEVGFVRALMTPWRLYNSPRFFEASRVPRDRPVMFVVNHTLYGVLDTPLLMLGLLEHTGHFVRSMGDHLHFTVPLWRDLLSKFGAVPGTRENCRLLMQQRQSVIVYPGGGREVYKRKGEAYRLLWGMRSGFARLALESGYPIVPVAAVGADDAFRILLDQEDALKTSLGRKIADHAPRKDVVFPPIVAGVAGTLLPRPERYYFLFGHPIESELYVDRSDQEAAVFALREEVRIALEALIAELIRLREGDPGRHLRGRLLGLMSRSRAA